MPRSRPGEWERVYSVRADGSRGSPKGRVSIETGEYVSDRQWRNLSERRNQLAESLGYRSDYERRQALHKGELAAQLPAVRDRYARGLVDAAIDAGTVLRDEDRISELILTIEDARRDPEYRRADRDNAGKRALAELIEELDLDHDEWWYDFYTGEGA